MFNNNRELQIIIEALQEEVFFLKERCRTLEAERDLFYNFYKDYLKDMEDEYKGEDGK